MSCTYALKHRAHGFSLVELMVVVGISSIVVLAISALTMDMFRAQRSVSGYAEFNSYAGQIQMILNIEPSLCGSALRAGDGVTPVSLAFASANTLSAIQQSYR